MSKVFFSEFKDDVCVCIATDDDVRYPALKPLFDEYGFGFTMGDGNVAMINGSIDLSEDELKWVEAHEIAHILLKHVGKRNSDDEVDADTLAHLLLKDKGYDKAADLVFSKFRERHGKDLVI